MKPSVLIVDTDHGAPLLSRLLGAAFETSCATTWDDALRSLREKPPQVVLVGYHFDEARPYHFIGRLRDDALARDLPVLLVRGLAVQQGPYIDREIRESYRKFGADDYLAIDKGSAATVDAEDAERLRNLVRALLRRKTPLIP